MALGNLHAILGEEEGEEEEGEEVREMGGGGRNQGIPYTYWGFEV